jgi:acetolactate synthase I/II/III large subunit
MKEGIFMEITGAKLFVEALKKENVEFIFGYPGGYVIPLFDELFNEPSIELILPRHEQGLVHAADGYARSTGKVGVCLVTSGPGVTNTITGLATANFDSVPLVCFTGQVPSHLIGNDAFQEADAVGLTLSVTKHNFIVNDRKDLGRIIKEAFFIAATGRPGVVLVDLPVDIIRALGDDVYPETVNIRGYNPYVQEHPNQIKKAADVLMNSKKPLFLVGGGLNISEASEVFKSLVEITNIPVVSTLQGIGAIPTKHPLYIGMLGMHGIYAANQAISECDLIFSIGCRFNDRITGNLSKFASNATIVHIDIDPAAISRDINVEITIVGDAKAVIEEILPLVSKTSNVLWNLKIDNWKMDQPLVVVPGNKRISPMEVIQSINKTFPEAIITTDVGQHQMWTAQFGFFNKPRTLLTSGGFGTMGYGLPAAIGAQIGNRDKVVINISGDGGIQMNIQELATAVQEELPIIIAVFNNNYLGMVRQWQGLFYNKRYSGTCLRRRISCPKECNGQLDTCPEYTPDFVKLAEAYGAIGIRAANKDEIIPALERAGNSKTVPVLIEFNIEHEFNVMPMVPAGCSLTEMLLEGGV